MGGEKERSAASIFHGCVPIVQAFYVYILYKTNVIVTYWIKQNI